MGKKEVQDLLNTPKLVPVNIRWANLDEDISYNREVSTVSLAVGNVFVTVNANGVHVVEREQANGGGYYPHGIKTQLTIPIGETSG